MKRFNRYYVLSLISIFLFYVLVSNILNKEIILPKIGSIIEYYKNLSLTELMINIASTFNTTIIAFLISLFLGLILGAISCYKQVYLFMSPYIAILKTLPTISIIIVSLFLLGKVNSLYFIAVLVILPIFYEMFYHHFKNVDNNLKEVAIVYNLNRFQRIKYLYSYSIFEAFFLTLKQTFGLSFKIIVMSEFIASANSGIGAKIYDEKTIINSAGVFAWTIILILIVLIMDKLIDYARKSFVKWK